MFVGHLAVAFAGKRAAPATSLVWFVVAANLVDLVWPLFLLIGAEVVHISPGITAFTPLDFAHYPWTRSLVMGIGWAGALALLAAWRGVPRRDTWILAALVLSHWVLDVVTHRPDMPLWPGESPRFGFGLWNSIAGTFAVESVMWVAGIALLLRVRRPQGAHGWTALGSFVVVCTALWAFSPFSPPPPTEQALVYFSLFGWIIVPWAWWIERTSAPTALAHSAM
jgi:hypothetical protein